MESPGFSRGEDVKELNKDKIVSAVRATEYGECAFALSRPKKEKEKVEEFILHLFDGYPRYHIVEITVIFRQKAHGFNHGMSTTCM